MPSAAYRRILEWIIQTDEAETTGFNAAMSRLDNTCDCGCCAFAGRPAAYRIEDPDGSGWEHVHVYEIALAGPISSSRLRKYANLDDGDGPHVTLHIVNGAYQRVTVPAGELMCLAFAEDIHLALAEYLIRTAGKSGIASGGTSLRTTQSPQNTNELSAKLTLSQRKNAAFRALRELGIEF